MFEEMTSEAIMDAMLANIPDTIDKREGSIIYDALAPISVEVAQVYSDMDLLLDQTFADSADEYYLIKRSAERGILQRSGTPAEIKIRIEPVTYNLENGTKFNIGELNYTVSDNLGNGFYAITCEDSGVEGNNTEDDIIPLDYIDGLESVEIESIITPGTDDESEDSLRNRYFGSFGAVAGNGNQQYYIEEAEKCSGVQAAKVEPIWNGEGTVKIYILASGYDLPSEELITKVQNIIDKKQDGLGADKAMIGHVVTVVSASQEPVTVELTLQYADGYTFADVKESIAQNIRQYLTTLAQNWNRNDHITVRRGEIESIILNMEGIRDVVDVHLNNLTGNVIVSTYSVPVLAEVKEAADGKAVD